MHIPELLTIKNMRKQIGLNQAELARAAGVSQSLIARIESGKVDPSYSKMKQIFSALEKLGRGKVMLAKDILNKKIISVPASKTVMEAAKIMRKHEISQLPVMDNDFVVGSISEKAMLDMFANSVDLDELINMRIKDIMENSFPQIDKNSPLGVVSLLLEYNNAVLVVDEGKPAGIITRSDLLKLLK